MGWLSGWDERIKLTIDKDLVDTANLTNFPVMVYLSAASGIGDIDVSCVFDELASDANRKKIAVTSSDGTTELYVEIERWDDANEKAWLHIKVPTVAYDADTILYLYYDADHADNDTYVGDTTDAVAHNVWDANFVAVYHMAQDPNGDGADAIKDSTSNANEGSPAGTMLTADLVDGTVGKSIDFDGSDDLLSVDDAVSLDLENGITIESIINPDTFGSLVGSDYYGRIIRKGGNFDFRTEDSGSATETLGFYHSGMATTAFADASSIALSTWQYVAVTYDETDAKFYVDNTAKGTVNDAGAMVANADNLIISNFDSGATGRFFDGKLDEIRISNTDRSAPWLKATYHSLFDSLITFTPVVHVAATTATLTLSTNAATVIGATTVNATCPSLTITANAATVAYGIPVNAALATLTVATYSADIKYDVNALGSLASLTIAGQPATISWDLDVLASSPALIVTTHNAVVWDGAEWALWIAANGGKVVRKYYFTLTGDGEDPVVADVEIPMASFQCRRRSAAPTYLSVVVKDTDYSAQINARSNGDMKVEMVYELYGEIIYQETIAIVDLEDIRLYEGGSNASISLIGHRTHTYTAKQITLRDIVYYQLSNGKYNFRCSVPDLFLAPGDTAVGDGNSFTVDQIQYTVSVEQQTMTVKET